ncbi:hypothetical protein EDEG_02057 [Edhazardia aedis USNM 41457]|uniref:Uncharacterized protein n=1 Tax=Edhazardia aedis (strain USNM 41457) TaxID=1003232 RepID=J9D775_EDHAE|nr:hypothetical protein EDEG_02057 [Edhazardia aedis USNM 41457]|eukprot:EJW03626.1 hypothetical protein EDEG_02057 [Edhazardia aedis USNM 41457]
MITHMAIEIQKNGTQCTITSKFNKITKIIKTRKKQTVILSYDEKEDTNDLNEKQILVQSNLKMINFYSPFLSRQKYYKTEYLISYIMEKIGVKHYDLQFNIFSFDEELILGTFAELINIVYGPNFVLNIDYQNGLKICLNDIVIYDKIKFKNLV